MICIACFENKPGMKFEQIVDVLNLHNVYYFIIELLFYPFLRSEKLPFYFIDRSILRVTLPMIGKCTKTSSVNR